MRIRGRIHLAAVLLLTAGLVQAEGNPEAGKSIVMAGSGQGGAPCLACHGMDGGGMDAGGFPRLAGLDAGYLAGQMRDYRDGVRKNAVMEPNVKGLSDAQIDDLAAYYANQKAAQAKVEAAEEVLALGEKLVKQGDWDNYIAPCETCHGPGSKGVGATFPGLAGQHPTYISQQLKAWQSGARNNDPNQLMLAIAARLNDEQIAAVAAYLATQPAGE